MLGLPPYNDVFEVYLVHHGDEADILLRDRHRSMVVRRGQEVRPNSGGVVLSMHEFTRNILGPALFSSKMGDTGVRVEVQQDRLQGHCGILRLLLGCNRAGSPCDVYTLRFEFVSS